MRGIVRLNLISMKIDIVSLRPLYDFVRDNPTSDALNGSSVYGRAFATLVRETLQPIPATQGVYVWGAYNSKGDWRHIYVGQARSENREKLRARLIEELSNDRCCLWRSVMSEAELYAACQQHYPEQFQVYKPIWERVLLKAGTTHIVWVADSTLTDSLVDTIEDGLIVALDPTANKDRSVSPKTLRPSTLAHTGAYTREVLRRLKQRCREACHTRYRIEEVIKRVPEPQ